MMDLLETFSALALISGLMNAVLPEGSLRRTAAMAAGLLMLLIASYAMSPLCQTLAAAMLYRLASALMQPVSDGPLSGCIHDFGRVLMLLFIVQLCAAAMFLMLIAQMIAVSGMTMMLR